MFLTVSLLSTKEKRSYPLQSVEHEPHWLCQFSSFPIYRGGFKKLLKEGLLANGNYKRRPKQLSVCTGPVTHDFPMEKGNARNKKKSKRRICNKGNYRHEKKTSLSLSLLQVTDLCPSKKFSSNKKIPNQQGLLSFYSLPP